MQPLKGPAYQVEQGFSVGSDAVVQFQLIRKTMNRELAGLKPLIADGLAIVGQGELQITGRSEEGTTAGHQAFAPQFQQESATDEGAGRMTDEMHFERAALARRSVGQFANPARQLAESPARLGRAGDVLLHLRPHASHGQIAACNLQRAVAGLDESVPQAGLGNTGRAERILPAILEHVGQHLAPAALPGGEQWIDAVANEVGAQHPDAFQGIVLVIESAVGVNGQLPGLPDTLLPEPVQRLLQRDEPGRVGGIPKMRDAVENSPVVTRHQCVTVGQLTCPNAFARERLL